MAEHTATVTVNAPVHQVYELFTHFNDFPKFMTFVKEVTYRDDLNSHWVADIVGRHEWDAVNENWIPDQQIGWRSTDGLENSGRVTFTPQGDNQTMVVVAISYNPPAGFLGDIGEALGSGKRFETALQHDMNNFAKMVAQAPPGALDPTSSNYLFHEDSAAAKGQTTDRQDDAMTQDTGQTTVEATTSWKGSSAEAGRSGMGYNTGTSAVSTDSTPTTGTATTWNDNTMAGNAGVNAGGESTVGQAAAVANMDNPITAVEQEDAVGTEGVTVVPVANPNQNP